MRICLSSGHIIKVILKNNVKDRKSCIPKPHVHAFYIFNFRGQIAIPRTQNSAQMPHPRVILGDHIALHVLKKISYRTELYMIWKRYFSSNVTSYAVSLCARPEGRSGEGVLPEQLCGAVQPTSQNPYPIHDQNLRFSPP